MTRPPQGARFDSLGRLAYVNALFIIGTLGTLITPAMLDGWAQLKWSATRLGAVAAVEPKERLCPRAFMPTISGAPTIRASFS